ncbi:MAG: OmpA family protein, partial [Paracoccaceae bacterium]
EALTPIPANGIDPRPQIESVRRNVTETAAQLRQRLSTVETTAKETIAGVAETVQSDVRAVAGDVTGVRGEIRTVEATLKSQVASVRAALQRDTASRSLGRAVRRLEESQRELVQLRAGTPSSSDRQVFADATASLRSLAVALGGVRGEILSALPQDEQPVVRQLAGFRDAMEQQAARLATLLGRAAPQIAQLRGTADLSLAEMADDLAGSADQLNVTVIGLVQAEAIRQGLPKPVVPKPTALETLREFVLTHAVFFTAATTLRDPTDAARTLDALARLLAQNDVTLRVVGYTDDTGGPDRNTSVSQERANAIVAELVQRGVRADRLISVGRTIGGEVSAQRGPDSPNRRVEFEIGFRGEVVR